MNTALHTLERHWIVFVHFVRLSSQVILTVCLIVLLGLSGKNIHSASDVERRGRCDLCLQVVRTPEKRSFNGMATQRYS